MNKEVKEGNKPTRMHERAYTCMCTFRHRFNERNEHIIFRLAYCKKTEDIK